MPKSAFRIALLAAASFTAACSARSKAVPESTNASASASEPTVVAVEKAAVRNMSHSLVVTAEFRPFQEVEVMSKVAGYVKSIGVDVGDRVRQGQVLAVLEVPEMTDDQTRARSTVSRSQAEVTHAEDELQRAEATRQMTHLSYTRLAEVAKQKPGLVAQQEVDDAHSRDLVAEAQVSAAKSAVATAMQQVQVSNSDLQRTKTLMDYLSVTAPFAGVITKRYADTGSMIQAGTSSSTQAMPLVRLSDNSLLRLILPVPESAVPTVHIGQQVDVRVPTLNRSFPGKVARFADRISQATRTMDTEVDVPNSAMTLIPGMFAEVNLTLDSRDGVLSVPVTAVDLANETSGRVTVVTAENKIAVQNVVLGAEDASRVEIKSGLNPGDMVVTGNRASLRAGQQVRPRLADQSAPATR